MRRLCLAAWSLLGLTALSVTQADEPPKSVDPRLKVELFAEHPQIVTPTGIDVDHRGRVFAIESNTHFPPEGYKGHPTDRVLVMTDTDGDGKADKISVFKDGLKHSMSVVVRPLWFPVPGKAPATSIYVATRGEIVQLHDDDGDEKADRQEQIVHLETPGNYPHNGLAGFAIDALGWMYFGFGENLGADYKIIGSDGTTLSGGGEGGNIYRCRLDGSKLSQIATGFWNPHANCFDAFGRLFSVDNDPDSRPPCRLLHVIPGGDYGYRFRNGRKGLHPFTSWNGEIPGTLPMVAGTGEAPSGILAYESDGLPEEYRGNLLVTSWGDHRIDRFRLQPKGTSFTSLAEPLITGGENFRPVGIATAPDGSLFCTDWVLRDYKLHGHGRIWRIVPIANRTSEVINLESTSKLNSPDLQSSTAITRRRDVLRNVAQTLASRSKQDREAAVPKFGSNPRNDIERFWALTSLRLDATSDRFIPDSDDPLTGWAASQPHIAAPITRHPVDPKGEIFRYTLTNSIMSGISTLREELSQNPNPRAFPKNAINHWRNDLSALLPLIVLSELKVKNESKPNEPAALSDQLLSQSLSIDDPFLFATVVNVLARQLTQDDFANYLIPDATPNVKAVAPRVRQTMLLAARKQAPQEDRLLRVALNDADSEVRRLAVQWAAEEKLVALKPRVEAVFNGKGMSSDLFLATLAALEMLNGKKPEDFDKTPPAQYVVPLLKDEQRSPAVRAQALRLVSPTDKSLTAPFFASLLKSDFEPLRLEALRTLQAAQPEVSGELLRELVANEKLDLQLRAEALVGLAAVAQTEAVGGPSRKLVQQFLQHSSPLPLRIEALRAARPLLATDAELLAAVNQMAQSVQKLEDGRVVANLTEQLLLAYSESKQAVPESMQKVAIEKPKTRQEWLDQLNRGRPVDVAAGRRVFFHPNGPGCFKCHTIDGRGGKVGPDLSKAVGNMNRIQMIQSILEPSREIAPQYVAWTFEMKDGKVVTGMVVHENEGKTIVGDAAGKLTEIKTHDVETRTPQKTSVMPDKLHERMTLQELRDLLAFLDSAR